MAKGSAESRYRPSHKSSTSGGVQLGPLNESADLNRLFVAVPKPSITMYRSQALVQPSTLHIEVVESDCIVGACSRTSGEVYYYVPWYQRRCRI